VLGLPEPRLAEGEAAGGPGLLPALRRHPRPASAQHHLPAAPKKETKAEAPAKAEKPKDPEGKPTEEAKKRAEELAERIEKTLGIEIPELLVGPEIPALPIPLPTLPGSENPAPADAQQLLDFLLAP
jgi:hypothetical protein